MSIPSTSDSDGTITVPSFTGYFAPGSINLMMFDMFVTDDCTLVMSPVDDGQKVGLRFWANDPTAGKVVTFPTGAYTYVYLGPSNQLQLSGLDYCEMMYCALPNQWALVSFNSQLIPPA